MSIKFNCQYCQRSLKVNQELAGKKARCPGCKKVISIPTLQPATMDLDVNIEEEAAAALAEQTAAVSAPAKEKAPIKFQCRYCDEEVEVSGDLAGKQTPCPECRRIIKVPLSAKTEPKDWRKADPRGPAAGLRRDEPPPPEGAWGSAVASSKVSQQALVEAEALPELVEKTTTLQWVRRILIASAAVILIGVGAMAVLHFRSQNLQKKAIDKALAFVPEEAGASKIQVFEAVEVHRAAGDYFFRADKADKARSHFKHAQARLRPEAGAAKSPTLEKDLLAIDLALSQVELGGEKEEIDKGKRIKWDDVYKDLRPTFLGIVSPEARIEALQKVSRILIQKSQAKSVETLVSYLNSDKERSEMLALVGLELASAGQKDLADQLANKALAPFSPAPARDEKQPSLKNPPSLIALLVFLDQEKNAEKLLKVTEPKELKNPSIDIRLGFSQGRAYQGNWDRAHQIALAPGSGVDRLAALVGVAAVALEKNPTEARKNLEAAQGIWDGKNADPWTLWRIVQLGLRVNMSDKMKPLAEGIADPALRSRALAELVRFQMANQSTAAMEMLEEEAKKESPNMWLLTLLSRHNARTGNGSSVLKAIDGWEKENLRPLGYAAVALGLQDEGK